MDNLFRPLKQILHRDTSQSDAKTTENSKTLGLYRVRVQRCQELISLVTYIVEHDTSVPSDLKYLSENGILQQQLQKIIEPMANTHYDSDLVSRLDAFCEDIYKLAGDEKGENLRRDLKNWDEQQKRG